MRALPHDARATSAQCRLRNILIEHLEQDKTGKVSVLLEKQKADDSTGMTWTVLSLTLSSPHHVCPTKAPLHVFPAAAEERYVSDTIKKQFFAPDNTDDTSKPTATSRKVSKMQG